MIYIPFCLSYSKPIINKVLKYLVNVGTYPLYRQFLVNIRDIFLKNNK